MDVDGTLVDTNYLHTLAWSRALREVGEWAPMNAIHRLIGMGGDQLVQELLGKDCPAATEARPRFYKELLPEVRLFPGARAVMIRLHELGLGVVLASSAPSDELEAIVRLLDADQAIIAKTTADDVSKAKPAPDVFLTAMRSARLDPVRVVAVGDSVWDVQGARAAGIGCIGVETGGFSRHELAEEGALFVYRDIQEMLDQLLVGPVSALLAVSAERPPT